MPGLYAPGDYDLAGFALGAVERGAVLPRMDSQRPGDLLIALGSSGPHANGYSLIRRIVQRTGLAWTAPAPFATADRGDLASALLEPTRIYVRSVLPLAKAALVKGGAHVTGGGLVENPPRAIAPGLQPRFDWNSWTLPPVFDWLQREGSVADHELRRTFNCGVGFVLIAAPEDAGPVLSALVESGEEAWVCGELAPA
jgi:phosphoribosylformylglycinamidine cyclo-ligase/phosphoribosylamine--glycine ligase/phosphoribosylglycinamide formyltransferase/phosphoribosylformylglycinamidine cyclo-ligase